MELLKNFVAFEGIDGSGKSTIIYRLCEKLDEEKFFFTAEPTDNAVGRLLRRALRGEELLCERTMAHLFASDRAEHLYGKEGILQKLNEGKTVISDRYLFSSLAYQGEMAGKSLTKKLNEDFPLPEFTLYFKIDVKSALSRLAESGAKLELYEKEKDLSRVSLAYEKVLLAYEKAGGKVKIVNAEQNLRTVVDEVLSFITRITGN